MFLPFDHGLPKTATVNKAKSVIAVIGDMTAATPSMRELRKLENKFERRTDWAT